MTRESTSAQIAACEGGRGHSRTEAEYCVLCSAEQDRVAIAIDL